MPEVVRGVSQVGGRGGGERRRDRGREGRGGKGSGQEREA